MQVALYLAEEKTQVKEAIPWVRCASGNVYPQPAPLENALMSHTFLVTVTLTDLLTY